MKTSGVVMEMNTKKDKVTVYTSNGQFLEVPAPGYAVNPGEIIEVLTNETKGHKQKMFIRGFLPAAAAVLALFMFLGIYLTVFSVPASAYVALDFNPSLELEVNRDARVTSARSYNEGGQKILNELNLKDIDVYKAVDLIMERALSEGFIKNNMENVVMASVVPMDNHNAVSKKDLQAVIEATFKEKKLNGYVSIQMSSEKHREEALKEGLSVNRYMVMNRYHEIGNNISAEEMNDRNMMELTESKEVSTMFEGHHYETGMNKVNNTHMQNSSDLPGSGNVNDQSNEMSNHDNNMNDMSGDNDSTNDTGMQVNEMDDVPMMNNVNEPDDNMHSATTEDKKQDVSDYRVHEDRYEGNMPGNDQMNQYMENGHY